MMQVMIGGSTVNHDPREGVAAVVVDVFDSAGEVEEHALAGGHGGEVEGEGNAEGVLEEAFERVGVEGAVGVGNVEGVMGEVDVFFAVMMIRNSVSA